MDASLINSVTAGPIRLWPGRANMVLAALAFVPMWALVYPEGLAWPFRALPYLRWAVAATSGVVALMGRAR
ncbi:hypothetical protein N0V85_002394 [Neurospora sp. IMI 360204]|nr:hypothetical protein N0V85_002394 [Neurospora sp. IMI 360204]